MHVRHAPSVQCGAIVAERGPHQRRHCLNIFTPLSVFKYSSLNILHILPDRQAGIGR
jgi:hypothetical protein